ncbi:MAG: B12-binding domain-containing radical SAM protein [Vicinamibacteria bacterium]|nr:B12-binding domain-containing radical SAM protein [Vicinamibacteria bacterium]
MANHILLSHGYFLGLDPIEQKVMRPYPPLGLLYLSAFLKREGHEVTVFDSTFSTPEGLIETLRKSRPRVLGLYANLMTRARIVTLIARANETGIPVVVGGPDASGNVEAYLSHGASVVVRGEGEATLNDLLARWPGGAPPIDVAGTSVRMGGVTFHGPDRPLIPSLSGHPWPDREAIPLEPYLESWRGRHGYGSISLITARGCPYTCRWCSRAVYGESHRRRPVDDVVAEIEFIEKRYAPERLWFVDDVFTIHKGWTVDFANRMKAKGIRIPFECISRAERVDEDVADALKGLGCFRVWIGSESGSQRILDAMDRRVTVEAVRKATRLLKSKGIEVGFFIMVGYEGEEDVDLLATVDHIRKSEPDIVLTTTSYPIQGTEYATDVSDRAVNEKPWGFTSDRETLVRGRRSMKYYEAARSWIENDAAAHRLRRGGQPIAALTPTLRATWARVRMLRRAGERVA